MNFTLQVEDNLDSQIRYSVTFGSSVRNGLRDSRKYEGDIFEEAPLLIQIHLTRKHTDQRHVSHPDQRQDSHPGPQNNTAMIHVAVLWVVTLEDHAT